MIDVGPRWRALALRPSRIRCTSSPLLANMPTEGGAESEADFRAKLRTRSKDPGTRLALGETWWRDHQKWLEEQGYMLRPRYRPGWTPSWRATKKLWLTCEDAQMAVV